MVKSSVMLSEKVADQILKMITIEKKFNIGDKLPNENELSSELGVSRTCLLYTSEILGNLQSPTNGKVYYLGKDVAEMTEGEYKKYRGDIQFIFQDPKGSMNPRFNVYEVMKEPLITLDIMPEGRETDELIKDYVLKVCLLYTSG